MVTLSVCENKIKFVILQPPLSLEDYKHAHPFGA